MIGKWGRKHSILIGKWDRKHSIMIGKWGRKDSILIGKSGRKGNSRVAAADNALLTRYALEGAASDSSRQISHHQAISKIWLVRCVLLHCLTVGHAREWAGELHTCHLGSMEH